MKIDFQAGAFEADTDGQVATLIAAIAAKNAEEYKYAASEADAKRKHELDKGRMELIEARKLNLDHRTSYYERRHKNLVEIKKLDFEHNAANSEQQHEHRAADSIRGWRHEDERLKTNLWCNLLLAGVFITFFLVVSYLIYSAFIASTRAEVEKMEVSKRAEIKLAEQAERTRLLEIEGRIISQKWVIGKEHGAYQVNGIPLLADWTLSNEDGCVRLAKEQRQEISLAIDRYEEKHARAASSKKWVITKDGGRPFIDSRLPQASTYFINGGKLVDGCLLFDEDRWPTGSNQHGSIMVTDKDIGEIRAAIVSFEER